MDMTRMKMSSVELQAGIDQCLSKMDLLVATAKSEGRDFSEKERAEFDTIESEARLLNATRDRKQKSDEIQSRVNAGEFPNVPDFLRSNGSGSSNGPAWQTDSRGSKFAILGANDKAAKLLKSDCPNGLGHYVVAKIFGPNGSTPPSIKAELSGDVNHLGAFLIPERHGGELVDMMRPKARLLEAGTRIVLMDSDNLTIPKVASDVVPQVKAQNAKFALSNPTFSAVKMSTMTAGCIVTMSRELVQDSRELLAEGISMLLVNAMAVAVDQWGLNGSGSEEPLGLLNRDGIGSTGSIGAVDWLDLAAAATALRNLNHEPTACILHPSRYDQLFNTEVGDGATTPRGWLGAPPTLANVRFLQSTNCPATKLVLGDFSKYFMGMRTAAEVEVSTQAGESFERHQVLAKISMRFDFVPIMEEAFHALEGLTD
jgi:HK97 family phage major capsid protein